MLNRRKQRKQRGTTTQHQLCSANVESVVLLRRIQTTTHLRFRPTHLRFRPKGPSVPIAWPSGPGPRAKKYFQAQRAGHSACTGDELPTRWAWTMVWWRFPWPAGPGYLNCWPFGPKHHNAFRPDLAKPSPQNTVTVTLIGLIGLRAKPVLGDSNVSMVAIPGILLNMSSLARNLHTENQTVVIARSRLW